MTAVVLTLVTGLKIMELTFIYGAVTLMINHKINRLLLTTIVDPEAGDAMKEFTDGIF